MKVKAQDLKLADVVEVFDGPFNTAIVQQVKDGKVSMFRPYGVTADFSYTAGVICYTGVETFEIVAGEQLFEVSSRKELR